jgi:hypothetical protein
MPAFAHSYCVTGLARQRPLDVNGDVIGVNTAIYSPTGGAVGIGFDIPADTAKMVVAQLKEHGAVTRGWLGVRIQAVTPEIADSIGMKQAQGANRNKPNPEATFSADETLGSISIQRGPSSAAQVRNRFDNLTSPFSPSASE